MNRDFFWLKKGAKKSPKNYNKFQKGKKKKKEEKWNKVQPTISTKRGRKRKWKKN